MKLIRPPACTRTPVSLRVPVLPPGSRDPEPIVAVSLLCSTNQSIPSPQTRCRLVKLNSTVTTAADGGRQVRTTSPSEFGWTSKAPLGQVRPGPGIEAADGGAFTPDAGR